MKGTETGKRQKRKASGLCYCICQPPMTSNKQLFVGRLSYFDDLGKVGAGRSAFF